MIFLMSNRTNHLAVWIMVVIRQLIGFGWYAWKNATPLRLDSDESRDLVALS